MQNLKAVTTGVVASIGFFWSIIANPAINGTRGPPAVNALLYL
jgi:hypothetical protein